MPDPRPASLHVVGTQIDTVCKEGAYLLRPDNPHTGPHRRWTWRRHGGVVEFTLPVPDPILDAVHGAQGVFLAS